MIPNPSELMEQLSALEKELDDNEPDYCAADWVSRFRRDNPTWTEEEIQSHIEYIQSKVDRGPRPHLTKQ